MMRAIAGLSLFAVLLLQGCTVAAVQADLSESHSIREVSVAPQHGGGPPLATIDYACGNTIEHELLELRPSTTVLGPLRSLPAPRSLGARPGTRVAFLAKDPHAYVLQRAASGALHWQRLLLPYEEPHYTAGMVVVKAVVIAVALALDVGMVCLVALALKDSGAGLSHAFGSFAGGFAGGYAGEAVAGGGPHPPPALPTRWIVVNHGKRKARLSLYGRARYHHELPPGAEVCIEVLPGRYTSKVEVRGYPTRRKRMEFKNGDEHRTAVP